MIDPVLVSLGGLEIRWYGVMIAIGVLAGVAFRHFVASVTHDCGSCVRRDIVA